MQTNCYGYVAHQHQKVWESIILPTLSNFGLEARHVTSRQISSGVLDCNFKKKHVFLNTGFGPALIWNSVHVGWSTETQWAPPNGPLLMQPLLPVVTQSTSIEHDRCANACRMCLQVFHVGWWGSSTNFGLQKVAMGWIAPLNCSLSCLLCLSCLRCT